MKLFADTSAWLALNDKTDKKYEDKELSFTDCTSFAIMEKLKLHKAFTFDEHFKKVGFEVF